MSARERMMDCGRRDVRARLLVLEGLKFDGADVEGHCGWREGEVEREIESEGE